MLQTISIWIIPVFVFLSVGIAFIKKLNIFDLFKQGAEEGFKTILGIFPTLLGLIMAIEMLKASGVFDIVVNWLSPWLNKVGFPAELVPFALMRPFSGSGSIAIANDIFGRFHPDSIIGKTISVMMGSTETSLYVMATYFGCTAAKSTRYTLVCAMIADLTGIIMSVYLTKLIT